MQATRDDATPAAHQQLLRPTLAYQRDLRFNLPRCVADHFIILRLYPAEAIADAAAGNLNALAEAILAECRDSPEIARCQILRAEHSALQERVNANKNKITLLGTQVRRLADDSPENLARRFADINRELAKLRAQVDQDAAALELLTQPLAEAKMRSGAAVHAISCRLEHEFRDALATEQALRLDALREANRQALQDIAITVEMKNRLVNGDHRGLVEQALENSLPVLESKPLVLPEPAPRPTPRKSPSARV